MAREREKLFFGYSVSLHEDYALIGRLEIGSFRERHIFLKKWFNMDKVKDYPRGSSGDRFGRSVSLFKDNALIGAIVMNQTKALLIY